MDAGRADRLAAWAKKASRELMAQGELAPGSPGETEVMRHWRIWRPKMVAAMEARGALRALAHVLVTEAARTETLLLQNGYPPSDANEEATREWLLQEPEEAPDEETTDEETADEETADEETADETAD
jgi:hypothetical protein